MISITKIKPQDIITLTFATILIIIVIFILWLLNSGANRPDTQKNDVEIVLTPTPTPIPTQANSKPLIYDQESNIKLLDKLKNRTVLLTNDMAAKSRILSYLPYGETSGVIYETNTIQIEYVYTLDEFIVEIRTSNIKEAKAQANIFFISNGMSQKGICDLPLNFYPNAEVAQYLIQNNQQLNVLANSCD